MWASREPSDLVHIPFKNSPARSWHVLIYLLLSPCTIAMASTIKAASSHLWYVSSQTFWLVHNVCLVIGRGESRGWPGGHVPSIDPLKMTLGMTLNYRKYGTEPCLCPPTPLFLGFGPPSTTPSGSAPDWLLEGGHQLRTRALQHMRINMYQWHQLCPSRDGTLLPLPF